MSTKNDEVQDPNHMQLVGPDFLAARWSCSRSTVIRYLTESGIPAVVLGKKQRALRRYRLADVVRFEQSAANLGSNVHR